MTREEKLTYIANSVYNIEGAAAIVARTRAMYGRVKIQDFSGIELEDCYSLVYIFNNPFKK